MIQIKYQPLIPELTVQDLSLSLGFYTEICAFKVKYMRAEDGFAFLERESAQIMLEQRNGNWEVAPLVPPFGRGINFQIAVTDIHILEAQLKKHQIPLWRDLHEAKYRVEDTEICQKQLLVQDPDGYLLRFSQTVSIP